MTRDHEVILEPLDNRQVKENNQQVQSKIPVKKQMNVENNRNGNNSITHDIENLITSPLNDADRAAIEERINNIKVNACQ